MGMGTNRSESLNPANIHITQQNITIGNLMERLEHQKFDLRADFQDQRTTWTPEQQSRLIESLMLKIPLPVFYFDVSEWEKWKVIDGLQRLRVIQDYLAGSNGKTSLKPFSGFQYFTDFNAYTFDQLPRQYIRHIRDSQIIAYTIEKGTPEAVVRNIIQRIHTGNHKETTPPILSL